MPNRSSGFSRSFAILWCGLAAAQSYRAFAGCSSASPWAAAFWLLHVAALAAPLFALPHVLGRPGGQAAASDVPLGLTLLIYVPLTVAMRLLELCRTPA